MIVGGRPLVPEILDQPTTVGAIEIANFQPIFAGSASAVTPSKKVQLTRTVHYALSNEPKMNIVHVRYPKPPPQRGLKNAKRPFSV